MTQQNKISGVVITFNEERNIADCIVSMQGVVDEIVVVDSFSTDSTPEICKKLGVKFVQNPFAGHIQQKNLAMRQASFDYVLSLDADERLSPALREAILQEKINLTSDAYRFNRYNNFYGKWLKHGQWYPDDKIRLWNRKKAQWGGMNPHDRVILTNDLTVKWVKKDILHYSYPDIQDHFNQMVSFAKLAAESGFRNGKKSNLFLIIFSPLFKFLKRYFFRFGFLDGYYGFIACLNASLLNYFKYVNLLELQKKKTIER